MYKRIQSACVSHLGNVRKNNEDNYFFNNSFLLSDNDGSNGVISNRFALPVGSNKGIFYAVFDGMGGGDYGEIASFKCAEETKIFLSNERNINYFDISPTLQHLSSVLNEAVFREKTNLGVYQMGSTLVGIFMLAGRVWVCNVGDSRCYFYSSKSKDFKQLSIDHVEDTMQSKKPVLTQYLGVDPEVIRIDPSIYCFEPENNDRILLCSDGLTDMVSEEEICEAVKTDSPDKAVDQLLKKALVAGGRDNITMIITKFI